MSLLRKLVQKKEDPLAHILDLSLPAPAVVQDHTFILEQWRQHILCVKNGEHPSLFSMYIHIPFCVSRCGFCLCNAQVMRDTKKISSYITYLIDMLDLYAPVFSEVKFKTLYIGGGSPSMLMPRELDRLLAVIGERYVFSKNSMRAIECNPADMTQEKINILKKHGLNYVSLGVQSLQEKVLRAAHRPFIPFKRLQSLVRALKEKKMTVNLDLIYGFPEETPEVFSDGLRRLMSLSPDKVSLYQLEVRPLNKTISRMSLQDSISRFGQEISGAVRAIARTCRYHAAVVGNDHILEKKGSIIVRAKKLWAELFGGTMKGSYTDMPLQPFSILGFGHTARSHIYARVRYQMRITARSVFKPFCRDISGNIIDLRYEMLRFIVYTFRHSDSLSRRAFEERFHMDILNVFPAQIKKMLKQGTVVLRGGQVIMREQDIEKRLAMLMELIDTDVMYAAVMQKLKITLTFPEGAVNGCTCAIEKIQKTQSYVHSYNGFGMYYMGIRKTPVFADRPDVFKERFYEIVDVVSALEKNKELVSTQEVINACDFLKKAEDHMKINITL